MATGEIPQNTQFYDLSSQPNGYYQAFLVTSNIPVTLIVKKQDGPTGAGEVVPALGIDRIDNIASTILYMLPNYPRKVIAMVQDLNRVAYFYMVRLD